jgi:hypothetical protein
MPPSSGSKSKPTKTEGEISGSAGFLLQSSFHPEDGNVSTDCAIPCGYEQGTHARADHGYRTGVIA